MSRLIGNEEKLYYKPTNRTKYYFKQKNGMAKIVQKSLIFRHKSAGKYEKVSTIWNPYRFLRNFHFLKRYWNTIDCDILFSQKAYLPVFVIRLQEIGGNSQSIVQNYFL